MRAYRERLAVPVSWWLLGLTVLFILGAELAAGFGWLAAALIYLVLTGSYAAMLVSWGRAKVEVAGGELRAGARRLPLAATGEVTALDERQTRAMRGPRADPAAFLLVRPYLRRAVYVPVAEGTDGTPYWLVASRHPAELAAAISQSRAAARPGGAAVG